MSGKQTRQRDDTGEGNLEIIPPTKLLVMAKETAAWAGLSTTPKRLFCSAGRHRGRRLVGLIPFQAVAWSVLAATLSLVGSRRDKLGFVPQDWSQCVCHRSQPRVGSTVGRKRSKKHSCHP